MASPAPVPRTAYAKSPRTPTQVPSESALPEPALGVAAVIGAGAAAGVISTAAGTAAGAAATAPVVPALEVAQESVEAILQGLRRFFVLMRAREQAWLVRTLGPDGVGMPMPDLLELIAEESRRSSAFAGRVEERVRRDVGTALNLPVGKRRDALDAILHRERVYAEQRSRAMAVRGLHAADRAHLRVVSPAGASWELGRAERHTRDCLAMAGRTWPWEALEVIRPPTHTGCRCRLRAAAPGWRSPDVDAAVRAAHRAKAMLEEGERGR